MPKFKKSHIFVIALAVIVTTWVVFYDRIKFHFDAFYCSSDYCQSLVNLVTFHKHHDNFADSRPGVFVRLRGKNYQYDFDSPQGKEIAGYVEKLVENNATAVSLGSLGDWNQDMCVINKNDYVKVIYPALKFQPIKFYKEHYASDGQKVKTILIPLARYSPPSGIVPQVILDGAFISLESISKDEVRQFIKGRVN